MKFNLRKHISKLIYMLISIGIFIMVWYGFTLYINQVMNDGIEVLPYPFEVIETFLLLLGNAVDGNTLIDHVGASLLRVFSGVTYAFLLGVPLGLLIGSNSILDKIFKPTIELFRPIPPIAWIPLTMIVFGLGLLSSSFVIFIGAFFPIFQNSYDGVKQTNQIYTDVARSLGASKSDIALEIIIPAITPNILTGLKVSLGVGWMCVISAEMMGVDVATGGIGYFINYMKDIGNYGNMMAGMMMIALIGLVLNVTFEFVERYLLRWNPRKGENDNVKY